MNEIASNPPCSAVTANRFTSFGEMIAGVHRESPMPCWTPNFMRWDFMGQTSV